MTTHAGSSSSKNRRGRPASRNSSSSSFPTASVRIGRRDGHNASRRTDQQPLPNEPDPERDIYVVESLLKVRLAENHGDERYFFVKWLNYPSSQNTWEPESNLSRDLVLQWDRDHGGGPGVGGGGKSFSAAGGSERSASRADSKLSVADSADSVEVSISSKESHSAKSKAKKRLLPTSPKAHSKKATSTVSAAKSPLPSSNQVGDSLPSTSCSASNNHNNSDSKSSSQHSNQTNGNNNRHVPSTVVQNGTALNKMELLEMVGSIVPERILAVYKEADDELCYLVKRSDISSDTSSVPSALTRRPTTNDDCLQIISSQVFDMLWPNFALEYYESSVHDSVCSDSQEFATARSESLAKALEKTTLGSGSGAAAVGHASKVGGGGGGGGGDSEEGEDEYEVEKVIDMQYRGSKRWYLLKWVGYSHDDNTWEPEDGLNCPHLLDAFWASRPDVDPRKKKKLSVSAKSEKAAAVLPSPKKPQKILSFHIEGAAANNNNKYGAGDGGESIKSSMEKWRFLVKWPNDLIPEVVSYSDARQKWPNMVLRFFQRYLDDSC